MAFSTAVFHVYRKFGFSCLVHPRIRHVARAGERFAEHDLQVWFTCTKTWQQQNVLPISVAVHVHPECVLLCSASNTLELNAATLLDVTAAA
jgi:hypothetical protein